MRGLPRPFFFLALGIAFMFSGANNTDSDGRRNVDRYNHTGESTTMNATTTRRAMLAGAEPKLRVVQQPVRDRENAFTDLENQICGVDRAARIAFLMMMRDAEHDGDEESLGLFAIEQVERLASELRASFYLAYDGKAAQS
jgi:hypothetical protein